MAELTTTKFHPRRGIHKDVRVRMAELDIGPSILGQKIGVSRQYVSLILSGARKASRVRRQLEKMLEVEEGWLDGRL